MVLFFKNVGIILLYLYYDICLVEAFMATSIREMVNPTSGWFDEHGTN